MIDTDKFSVSQEFDAFSFEMKREKIFQREENLYIEYEIDSVEEEFGELFRVWDRLTLVGTFYETFNGKWKANPFYENKQLIKWDRDLSETFENKYEALAHIKSTYESKALILAA